MALSPKSKQYLFWAVTAQDVANELSAAIDASTSQNATNAANIATNTASIAAARNGVFDVTTNVETISAAGAISISILESILSNASGATFAATLAAPSADGILKILTMTAHAHTVTVAATNIDAGTGTVTFTAQGDSILLMSVGGKWRKIGGNLTPA